MKVNSMQETNGEHVHTDTPQEDKKKKKKRNDQISEGWESSFTTQILHCLDTHEKKDF